MGSWEIAAPRLCDLHNNQANKPQQSRRGLFLRSEWKIGEADPQM